MKTILPILGPRKVGDMVYVVDTDSLPRKVSVEEQIINLKMIELEVIKQVYPNSNIELNMIAAQYGHALKDKDGNIYYHNYPRACSIKGLVVKQVGHLFLTEGFDEIPTEFLFVDTLYNELVETIREFKMSINDPDRKKWEEKDLERMTLLKNTLEQTLLKEFGVELMEHKTRASITETYLYYSFFKRNTEPRESITI